MGSKTGGGVGTNQHGVRGRSVTLDRPAHASGVAQGAVAAATAEMLDDGASDFEIAAREAEEAEAAAQAAETELAALQQTVSDGPARIAEAEDAHRPFAEAQSAALADLRDKGETARSDATAVRAEVKRIYTEHGVPDRMAGHLAGDVMDANAKFRCPEMGRSYASHEKQPTLPGEVTKLKTKRGPLAESTKAASAAASSDERLAAANERLAASRGEWKEARDSSNAAFDAGRDTSSAVTSAQRAVRDAEQALPMTERRAVEARGRADRAAAAAEHGLAGKERRLGEEPVTVVRGPGGGTNAWVWRDESGSWDPVVDVEDRSDHSVLVTADGERHVGQEYWSPGSPDVRRSPRVIVDDRVKGDRLGSMGFRSVIDSSG